MRRTSLCQLAIAATAGIAVVGAIAAPATAAAGPTSHHHGKGVFHSRAGRSGSSSATTAEMTYHGGAVSNAPVVYVVYWGNQWGTGTITNDPANEAPLQQNFFNSIGGAGDTWSASTTQYCSGGAVGDTGCAPTSTFVGEPATSPLAGTWLDDSVSAPSVPTDNDLQAEALRAEQHFALTSPDQNVQIVIDSPTGVRPQGSVLDNGSYCAYHSSLTDNLGNTFTYTNMPYLPDAGSSCGANYVPVGSSGVDPSTEGVTIVGGHEYGETVTDPIFAPNATGWITDNDPSGGENGDKCAWTNGYSTVVTMNGGNFAVQSLWSNNDNAGAGGCVTNYVSAANQS